MSESINVSAVLVSAHETCWIAFILTQEDARKREKKKKNDYYSRSPKQKSYSKYSPLSEDTEFYGKRKPYVWCLFYITCSYISKDLLMEGVLGMLSFSRGVVLD